MPEKKTDVSEATTATTATVVKQPEEEVQRPPTRERPTSKGKRAPIPASTFNPFSRRRRSIKEHDEDGPKSPTFFQKTRSIFEPKHASSSSTPSSSNDAAVAKPTTKDAGPAIPTRSSSKPLPRAPTPPRNSFSGSGKPPGAEKLGLPTRAATMSVRGRDGASEIRVPQSLDLGRGDKVRSPLLSNDSGDQQDERSGVLSHDEKEGGEY